MNYVDVRKKKVFGPSVDVFPTLHEGIDLKGAQETPRAALRASFLGSKSTTDARPTNIWREFGSLARQLRKTGFLS